MRSRGGIGRRPELWLAGFLLLMALLVACGSNGATTSLTSLATATTLATDTPFATLQTTSTAASTNTPRPTATPTRRPAPTATPKPKPTATATATATATPTATTPPPTATPAPKTWNITISGFAFSPTPLTIRVGDTVTWTNNDFVDHTTTSDATDPASWDSGSLANGATFSFTFTKPGTYTYHCNIHPSMTGTITVMS